MRKRMRDIKFRVWIKGCSEPKYIGSEYDDSEWGSNYAVIDNKHIVECYADENYDGDRKEFFEYFEIECLEQYTGLKDKNGKEIYEGDIVRYSFINPNRTYTEPVSFGPIQDGEGYYHQEFLAWRTIYVDDGTGHSSLLDLVEPNCTCEVIGNIHENPELLEEEK